ncbi:MAG: ABC-F family ATP-binding cassette domain-containing protein [Bacteroides sp.]|nr:ABC-F family ATP-binding cassette domain-containing protein [Bacteroides sp.]
MSYFQAQQITKAYGEKVLFEDLSFSVSVGQKVGLIARNGTGKTTLLNIIAGLDQPDSGICTFQNGIKQAYLQQEPFFKPNLTISEALLNADNEISRTVREYEELLSTTGAGHDTKLNERLHLLVERMDALQAWDYESRVKQVLTQLKIGRLDATVDELSGGQVKRLALARILIEEADLILLDEPTNHLDLEMIEWLESYLARKKLTILLVTHDRYFLDAVCNEIIELENGKLYNYRGNYSYFLEKKQERLEAETAFADRATNLLRKETEWMRRMPQARTTKSKARIDSFYELKDQAVRSNETGVGEIKMEMARLGKKILELENITKRFDGKPYVNDFSYVFKRGERAGIVGPNGSGKSTLLNLITSSIQADSGKITIGETIRYGYYRQEGLQVNDNKKVIEVISDIAESISLGKGKAFTASQFLHYFNFPYHVQNDYAGKLSGGEKRRLYLMTVLMQNPNFLILDEPTNDLDIATLNVLEDFLENYEGCLLIVSHDRYFLDRLVDHVFVFGENGRIKDFPGNYTQYRLSRNKQVQAEKKTEKAETPAKPEKTKEKTKLTFKEQKEFEILEKEIEVLEVRKAELIEKMNTGKLSPEELLDASQKYAETEEALETKTNRWIELSEWA